MFHSSKLLLLATLLLAGCVTNNAPMSGEEAQIRAVLDQQVRDWNAGSVERFMHGYARADTTRFASGGEVTLGWQTVFDRYARRYDSPAAMGRLTFSDVDVTVTSADSAVVFGHWRLDREKDTPTGLFTLVFRRLPEGWRIVHDHTSAVAPKSP